MKLVKVIMLLIVAVVFANFISGGGDFSNILDRIENLLNTTALGPLGPILQDAVSNMKEAYAYLKQEIPKLLDMIQHKK